MLLTAGWATPVGQMVRKLDTVGATTVRPKTTAAVPAGTIGPVTWRLNGAVEEILPGWPPSDIPVSRIRVAVIGWNTVSVSGENGSAAAACGGAEVVARPPAALALAGTVTAESPARAAAAIIF